MSTLQRPAPGPASRGTSVGLQACSMHMHHYLPQSKRPTGSMSRPSQRGSMATLGWMGGLLRRWAGCAGVVAGGWRGRTSCVSTS